MSQHNLKAAITAVFLATVLFVSGAANYASAESTNGKTAVVRDNQAVQEMKNFASRTGEWTEVKPIGENTLLTEYSLISMGEATRVIQQVTFLDAEGEIIEQSKQTFIVTPFGRDGYKSVFLDRGGTIVFLPEKDSRNDDPSIEYIAGSTVTHQFSVVVNPLATSHGSGSDSDCFGASTWHSQSTFSPVNSIINLSWSGPFVWWKYCFQPYGLGAVTYQVTDVYGYNQSGTITSFTLSGNTATASKGLLYTTQIISGTAIQHTMKYVYL